MKPCKHPPVAFRAIPTKVFYVMMNKKIKDIPYGQTRRLCEMMDEVLDEYLVAECSLPTPSAILFDEYGRRYIYASCSVGCQHCWEDNQRLLRLMGV
jgi:hypothetical protein